MKLQNFTPVEVFFLYDLLGQKVASSTPSDSSEVDLQILRLKLREMVLDTLQSVQDDAASAGFKRWQVDTINKIHSLNESMKRLSEEESSYRTTKSENRRSR